MASEFRRIFDTIKAKSENSCPSRDSPGARGGIPLPPRTWGKVPLTKRKPARQGRAGVGTRFALWASGYWAQVPTRPSYCWVTQPSAASGFCSSILPVMRAKTWAERLSSTMVKFCPVITVS